MIIYKIVRIVNYGQLKVNKGKNSLYIYFIYNIIYFYTYILYINLSYLRDIVGK